MVKIVLEKVVKELELVSKVFVTLAIIFIIFWDLMFYQIYHSVQVKWSTIISNKHGLYELPHELSNDLRLRRVSVN